MLKVSFGLLYLQDLRWIGGDDLILGIRSDDLDGDVLQSHEEYAFADVGLQQEILSSSVRLNVFWMWSMTVGDCFRRTWMDELVTIGMP